MRRSLLASVGAVLLLAGSAVSAEHGGSVKYIYGEVLEVTPIKEIVRVPSSREICWEEPVRHYDRRGTATPTIVGSIIGGVIGNQFGSGSGRDAATVAGAVLGGSVAHSRAKSRRYDYYASERRCRFADEYYEEERVVGYRVRYEHNGEIYTTRTERDPGERIRLRVSVSPAE